MSNLEPQLHAVYVCTLPGLVSKRLPLVNREGWVEQRRPLQVSLKSNLGSSHSLSLAETSLVTKLTAVRLSRIYSQYESCSIILRAWGDYPYMTASPICASTCAWEPPHLLKEQNLHVFRTEIQQKFRGNAKTEQKGYTV